MGVLPTFAYGRHIRVVVVYFGSLGLELFDQYVTRALSVVIHIGLIGQPQKQDF
jgi:hypothetical protein